MVGSKDSLANFNCQLNTHFKYHPESTQIVFSTKGNKKSYRWSCMNKTTAIAMPWTSLHYPYIWELFLPRDLTHQDILRRPHFKGSSATSHI
jgi:hypothetical protein